MAREDGWLEEPSPKEALRQAMSALRTARLAILAGGLVAALACSESTGPDEEPGALPAEPSPLPTLPPSEPEPPPEPPIPTETSGETSGETDCERDADCAPSLYCRYCGACFSEPPRLQADCQGICRIPPNAACRCTDGACQQVTLTPVELEHAMVDVGAPTPVDGGHRVQVRFHWTGRDGCYRETSEPPVVEGREIIHRFRTWTDGSSGVCTEAEVSGGFDVAVLIPEPGTYRGAIHVHEGQSPPTIEGGYGVARYTVEVPAPPPSP